MDQELLDLLARLNDVANPLTDEELNTLHSKVVAIASDIDPANATDDDIAVLTEAAEHAQNIQTQIDARAAAAAERAAKAEELRAAIVPKDETPAEEVQAEGDEAPAETPDEAPAETTDAPSETAEISADSEITAEAVAEPIAASSAPQTPELPRISRLAHRTPRTHRPVETATEKPSLRAALVASGDLPGIAAGAEIDMHDFAHGVVRRIETLQKTKAGVSDGEKIIFATAEVEYPEDRILSDNEFDNERKLDAVTSREALIASGGVCGPVGVDYNLAGVSSADRPVRDGMAQFGAARGGLRYVRPYTLSAVHNAAGTGVWTNTTDTTPGGSTKAMATYTCATVQEDYVDAVTSSVKVGNFQARYFPESIDNFMETLAADHARLAEATLLAAITSGSTAVTSGVNLLGAAAEVLAELDRAVAGVRYRNRIAADAPLRVVYPEFLEDMIRADLAREMPGNSGGQSERLAVADAEIDRFFTARNLNVTKTLDSPTGASVLQGFVQQGVGMLVPWPTKVTIWVYPEGSWTFLDGGTLDLGMIRDSTLARTNDVIFFSETFEKAIFRGVESLAITMDTCPSGQRANTVETSSLCVSGS